MSNVPPYNPGDEQRDDEAGLIKLLDQLEKLELELKSQIQEQELLENYSHGSSPPKSGSMPRKTRSLFLSTSIFEKHYARSC